MTRGTTALLFLLVVALTTIFGYGRAGNCTLAPPAVMQHGSVRVNVTGPVATVSPVDSAGNPVPGAEFSFGLDVVTERAKVEVDIYGQPVPFGPQCNDPSISFSYDPTTPFFNDSVKCLFTTGFCYVDPLTPAQDNVQCYGLTTKQPCGELLAFVSFEDLDCWHELVEDQIGSATRWAVVSHYSDPSSSFSAIASYSTVSEDVIDRPFPLLPDVEFQYKYDKIWVFRPLKSTRFSDVELILTDSILLIQ